MRVPTLFSTLAMALLVAAQQQQVKIADARVLDNPEPVRKSHGAESALEAAGVTAEQMAQVLSYGDADHWPEGIKTDSLRLRNQPYIQNYACFRVASYPEDSLTKTIIMVPARENIHMPEAMRPLSDFYLLVPESAITEVNTGKQRPEISRGPKWKNLAPAKILRPEDLYATYDIGRDSVALKALADRGMSQAEIDAVVFRSTDRNWPDGIDSFEERQKLLPKFKKYKAFLGAKWDDKVLLIVPVEKNKKQQILMRPFVDLYFVYNASAVEVKAKKKK
jgi:hypothetical protein